MVVVFLLLLSLHYLICNTQVSYKVFSHAEMDKKCYYYVTKYVIHLHFL